jgi:hypothetical protein
MQQPARAAAGAKREVMAVNQANSKSAKRGITGHARANYPASHDQHIDRLAGKVCQYLLSQGWFGYVLFRQDIQFDWSV